MKSFGVIFDMDGVLVDSYRAHFQSWRLVARRRGVEFTEAQFAATFGRTSRDIIRHFWPSHVRNEDDVTRWDRQKEAAYRDILLAEFPEMDGASELIAELHAAGAVMAVGSSGPPENVAVVMQCLPNARLISATVDGTQVAHGKPHPEVFLLAARKVGVAPEDCSVVEDAPAGVEAARRAGMAAIALTGTAPQEALAERAHLVVDSLRELSAKRVAQLIWSKGRTGRQ